MQSLSVIIPCYNEEENLYSVYRSVSNTLVALGIDYQIVIVNDGSTDDTSKILDAISGEDLRVRAVHHPSNCGYGSALRSGFNAANEKLIFFSDGDGQFDLNELPLLLSLIDRYDIIIGFRIHRKDNCFRRVNGWCWTNLVCFLFHLDIKDINCAFKLFRQEVLRNISLNSTGALINAEILARARRQGFSIAQVGVHHFPRIRGRPTGSNPKVIIHAFLELAKLYMQINRNGAVSQRVEDIVNQRRA